MGLTKDPTGKNKPLAILVTDFTICAEQAIEFFVGRWPIETTFQEINQHLGLETIHTWSDISVNRTAPTIIASYSIACLIVNESVKITGIEIYSSNDLMVRERDSNFFRCDGLS